MPIRAGRKKRLEAFLRECLEDRNKFVRAWAYGGFHQLAVEHAEYRGEAVQLFEKALDEEAASVKARVRKVVERGF